MDFQKRYESYLAIVEKLINEINECFSAAQQKLGDAMKYSVSSGGKRLRPVIFLSALDAFGSKDERFYPLAAAIECIHTYSLVHDDLPAMDNDDMRRGKPSTHKAFGEDYAVITGDALLNFAFETCFKVVSDCGGSENVVKACSYIAERAGYLGMIGGQAYDIDEENKQNSEEYLLKVDKLKTAELFKAAIVSAGLLCGRYTPALEEFAEKLGVIFQFADDLLDVSGEENLVGKTLGKDEKYGKVTAISVYGKEKTKELIDVLKERCLELAEQAGLSSDGFYPELIKKLAARTY